MGPFHFGKRVLFLTRCATQKKQEQHGLFNTRHTRQSSAMAASSEQNDKQRGRKKNKSNRGH